MIQRFFFHETDPYTGRRHKVGYESWPMTGAEPCNEPSGFARDYAMRWRDDPDFPDHPYRDRDENILLPTSLDQHPADYVDEHAPKAAPEPPPRLPMAGPLKIIKDAPGVDRRLIAAYEASRRGLRTASVRPAPPSYEPSTPPVSGHAPPMVQDHPKITPRYYERDPQHPKYRPRSS